jgi:formylglycine-generating enzyme required for sulfatase activity
MGSPQGEENRGGAESEEFRRIDRTVAVSTKEVAFGQLKALIPDHKQDPRFGDAPELPANRVTWYRAAEYCNKLSERAGIPPSEWCYGPDPVGPGLRLAADAVDRAGYRLPTEAEWEFLCRAGTRTSRPFGQSEALLSRYAWTWLNSLGRPHPVGALLPNESGLFDVLGNQWELCHDGPAPGEKRSQNSPPYPHGTPATTAPPPARSGARIPPPTRTGPPSGPPPT